MEWEIIIYVILAIFLGSLTRATFGFGDALVAMPFLSLVLGVRMAAPLLALVEMFIALFILAFKWRSVDFKSAWKLILLSILGIPAGIYILREVDEFIVKLILGSVITIFSMYQLFKPQLTHLKDDKWVIPFGLTAGVLGGAFNINGFPVAVYGNLRRWKPEHYVATLQGYFLPTCIFIILGHWSSGLIVKEISGYFFFSLPAVFLAVILGTYLNKKIPVHRFTRVVYLALTIIGVLFLLQTILAS